MEKGVDISFSKAVDLSAVKSLEKTLQKEFNQEYMIYNQLLSTSQEVMKNMGIEDMDIGTDLNRLKKAVDRRRSVRWRSEVGQRRFRSQALRRQKLNSQSLRSHLQHSKQASSRVDG
ncbi:unnamed protein product [Danaus chrysippus]|uniref:(African queen) hypothetical protein n=1 Tax=Danaus chrysippus TaxID=151541 RepID=A0A8J2VXR9_9NEOP|nr:unnamed protein product [Danaus chrysippus]